MRQTITLNIQPTSDQLGPCIGILVLANEGCRIVEFNSVTETTDHARIEFTVEAAFNIDGNFLAKLIDKYTGILGANMGASVNKRDGLSAIDHKLSEKIDAELKKHAAQIASSYKNIKEVSVKIQTAYPDIKASEYAFNKLGYAIGKWQYNKNYARGGQLDLDTSVKRMLMPAIKDFCKKVSQDQNIIECENGEVPGQFLFSFIEGFMSCITHLPKLNFKLREVGSLCKIEITTHK